MSLKYHIDTTEVHQHQVKIRLNFEAPWNNPIIEMPVWTPGSYKIRDYSRFVNRMRILVEGNEVKQRKISKNQWRIQCEKGKQVEVSYAVYANELTVRTNYLTDRYALLSPAGLFFYLISEEGLNNKDTMISLTIKKPDRWSIHTSLIKEEGKYSAKDFDELVDSPIGLAHPDELDSVTYEIENSNGQMIPCEIALIGHKGNHDLEQFKSNMIQLQQETMKMFGSLPYNRYLWVLYVVGSGGGGLEHKYSNFSIINRWYFNEDDELNYAKMLSLEAHEHFHTFNIKRIRPSQLGPFDYSNEVYTSLLWVAEGMTSFYDNVLLPRSELIEEEIYWKIIAKDYSSLMKVYGRFETSLMQSSYDAWIKLYQHHEGSSNLYVSYYLKGGLVTLMMDLEIREQTNWEKSLDDFFRFMWRRYQENGAGYPENELQALIEESTGTQLSNFWENYIDGTDPIKLSEYLEKIGMKIEGEPSKVPYTGMSFSKSKQEVTGVEQDSPAMNAGIYTKDKLVAFNGFEVTSSTFETLLKNYKGQSVEVLLIRDGVIRQVMLDLTEDRIEEYSIIPVETASEEQIAKRKKFLHKA